MQWLHVAGRAIGVTPYAARRMTTRHITVDEVRAVIARPTRVTPSRDSSFRLVYRRAVAGRRLAVVIESIRGDSWWEVVTAWEEGQDG